MITKYGPTSSENCFLCFSLAQRVENIETISGAINKKVTLVLRKLELLEDDQNKKKRTLSKLMDSFVDGEDEMEDDDEVYEEEYDDDDDMGDDDMGDDDMDDEEEDDSDEMGDDEM